MVMKKNMGNPDRIIRLVIAFIMIWLYTSEAVTGTWGYVLLAAAGILVLTSLFSFCPLYRLFGYSSDKSGKPA